MSKVKILSDYEEKCPYCNGENISEIDREYTELGDLTTTMCCKDCGRKFDQWFVCKYVFVGNGVGTYRDEEAEKCLYEEIDYEEDEENE